MYSQDRNEFLATPKLVKQQSVGGTGDANVQKWTYETEAANELLARYRTRRYVRTNFPRIKNVLEPDIDDVENTEQSTFRSFFPETFQQRKYTVEVTVVL